MLFSRDEKLPSRCSDYKKEQPTCESRRRLRPDWKSLAYPHTIKLTAGREVL